MKKPFRQMSGWPRASLWRDCVVETGARLLALILLTVGLCAGCVSMKPVKFEEQVHQWAPIGTPEADARKIMEHESFECTLVKKDNPFNQIGMDYLDCTRTQVWFHDWTARIIFKDGKVSGYGYIHVE